MGVGYSPTACNRRDYDDEGVFVGCTSNGTEGEVTPRNAQASGGNNTGGASCPSFTSDIGCMPTTDGVARYVSCKLGGKEHQTHDGSSTRSCQSESCHTESKWSLAVRTGKRVRKPSDRQTRQSRWVCVVLKLLHATESVHRSSLGLCDFPPRFLPGAGLLCTVSATDSLPSIRRLRL